MYCGKKSEMGERMKQLRLVYHTAKRVEMSQLSEILGQDTLVDGPSVSDAESTENMQVATPAMSTSSESDVSEGVDNRGRFGLL